MKIKTFIPPLFSILILLSCMISTEDACARKIRTRRPVAKETPDKKDKDKSIDSVTDMKSLPEALGDSLRGAIRFYGFDKTLTSSSESFFISSSLTDTVKNVVITLTYSDMQGRRLHKREVSIRCLLPPGETIRQDIRSWDTQKSFYYHKSAPPRRQATPFKVRIELKAVETGHR